MALVELKHVDTGARYSVPEHMVAAAERNGFERFDPDAPRVVEDSEEETAAEEEDVPEEDTGEENLSDLTNDELRERLDERGLLTSGNKDDLVARLEESE